MSELTTFLKRKKKQNQNLPEALLLTSLTLYRQAVMMKCCFTSTETVGLLGTGAQDGHLDFHTAPEL